MCLTHPAPHSRHMSTSNHNFITTTGATASVKVDSEMQVDVRLMFASGARNAQGTPKEWRGRPARCRGVACDARARHLRPRPAYAGFASEAPTCGAGVSPAVGASLATPAFRCSAGVPPAIQPAARSAALHKSHRASRYRQDGRRPACATHGAGVPPASAATGLFFRQN